MVLYKMFLKIYIEDNNLRLQYIDAVKKHNENMKKSNPDSGFDLFCPELKKIKEGTTQKIDLGVKCAAYNITRTHWVSYLDNSTRVYKNLETNIRTLEKPSDLELKDHYEASPFYLYPRSSIAKTPLRLSNSVGIIDSGYRGNLGAFVDNIHRSKDGDDLWTVEKHTRLFQICGPNLEPIEVEIVDNENDLGKTSRGSGGFGSTGI